MIALSIDTSTRFGSMGIYDTCSPKPLAQKEWEGSHSEVITEILTRLLTQSQVTLSDLERIYVGIGPGSFTGLRVAVNMARALSYSFSIPIWAADSLSILAWPHAKEKKNLSLVKMQRNITYVSAHSSIQDNFKELLPPNFMNDDEVLELIQGDLKDFAICGLVSEDLREKIPFPIIRSTPKSSDLIEYSFFHKNKINPMGWKNLIPLYIRTSSAEENRKGFYGSKLL